MEKSEIFETLNSIIKGLNKNQSIRGVAIFIEEEGKEHGVCAFPNDGWFDHYIKIKEVIE